MVGDLLTVLIKFMTEKGRKVKKDLASFLVFFTKLGLKEKKRLYNKLRLGYLSFSFIVLYQYI